MVTPRPVTNNSPLPPAKALPPAPPMTSTPSVCADGPLSLAQQRLWFLDQFERDPAAHQTSWLFHFRGPLDLSCLRDALDAIVARHEILRTTFPEFEGQPVAQVHPPG